RQMVAEERRERLGSQDCQSQRTGSSADAEGPAELLIASPQQKWDQQQRWEEFGQDGRPQKRAAERTTASLEADQRKHAKRDRCEVKLTVLQVVKHGKTRQDSRRGERGDGPCSPADPARQGQQRRRAQREVEPEPDAPNHA